MNTASASTATIPQSRNGEGVGFQVHPAADWLPLLPDDEYAELKADIEKRGLVEPILVKHGFIVDGRHRFKICLELGIDPKFVEYEGSDIVEEIASRNLFRRNLTPAQRAELVIKMCGDKVRAKAQARMKAGVKPDPSAKCREGRSSEELGRIARVSPRTIDRVYSLLQKRQCLPRPERQSRPKRTYPVGSEEWRHDLINRFRKFLDHWPITEHGEARRVIHEFTAAK
jgi:hypothetical protein